MRAFAVAVSIAMAAPAAAADLPEDPFRRPAHPTAPAFAFNPTTPEKAAVGCRLFFDRRLSKNNETSCASCHDPVYGWADRKARTRVALDGTVARRSQTVLGAGWVPRLGWSGGIDALEAFVLAPIARAHEMAQDLDELVIELRDDGDYRVGMSRAFGTPEVTVTRVSQALAAFVRTVVPGEAPFDRWRAGDEDAIPGTAKDGFDLFTGKARCAACHGGWRFTDDKFHDIGLPAGKDVGRALQEPDNPRARYAFKTPTLRNVEYRAPYMHDGSLPDLRSVVEHYTNPYPDRPSLDPMLPRVQLTDREKLNLVDFLLTLGGDTEDTVSECIR